VINASPYEVDKQTQREQAVARARIGEVGLPLVFVNLIGGQDELVFDGNSFVMNAAAQVTLRAPAFTEGLYPVDIRVRRRGRGARAGRIVPLQTQEEASTAPWSRARATTSTSTAFPAWSWACPAASTRR
jgi:NAD+ synthase (glutamine-hydrolysing)